MRVLYCARRKVVTPPALLATITLQCICGHIARRNVLHGHFIISISIRLASGPITSRTSGTRVHRGFHHETWG